MIAFVRARPRLFRTLFALYAAALVVATHWPRLHVPGAEAGSDKIAHFGAFFLWMALAAAAGLFPPVLSRQSLHRTAVLAAAYAVLDETAQLIPALERHASLLDGLVNLGGVAAAYALALMVIRPNAEESVNSS